MNVDRNKNNCGEKKYSMAVSTIGIVVSCTTWPARLCCRFGCMRVYFFFLCWWYRLRAFSRLEASCIAVRLAHATANNPALRVARSRHITDSSGRRLSSKGVLDAKKGEVLGVKASSPPPRPDGSDIFGGCPCLFRRKKRRQRTPKWERQPQKRQVYRIWCMLCWTCERRKEYVWFVMAIFCDLCLGFWWSY